MKCIRCHKDKLESSVSMKSDDQPWTKEALSEDKIGRRHIHVKTESTVSFECTQGHKWARRMARPCWCGWSHYVEENIASIRIFMEIWCWVGEDNFIMMNGKAYKGMSDVRLETSLMTEVDEIVLENESPFCSLLRGIIN